MKNVEKLLVILQTCSSHHYVYSENTKGNLSLERKCCEELPFFRKKTVLLATFPRNKTKSSLIPLYETRVVTFVFERNRDAHGRNVRDIFPAKHAQSISRESVNAINTAAF